jgi:hypothetical protein
MWRFKFGAWAAGYTCFKASVILLGGTKVSSSSLSHAPNERAVIINTTAQALNLNLHIAIFLFRSIYHKSLVNHQP